MNAVDLADLIGAQQRSRNVWAAKCPVCDYPALQRWGGRYAIADLECKRGCSIGKILRAFGISLNEYASRPKLTPPSFGAMDDHEVRAYYAAHREREAKHKAACEKIEHWRQELAGLERKIMDLPDDEVPSELEDKLDQAKRRLKVAHRQEKELRA